MTTTPTLTTAEARLDSAVALDLGTVADLLGMTRAAVAQQVQRGHLPSVRVGGRRLVPTSALRALLEPAGD